MTLIFAHRGYSAAYPENTMKAFKEALKAGADGIELDVQLSKDGEVVVIHDEKLDRTTNGSGFVRDFSLLELRNLQANGKKKILFENVHIPTLREVLEWLATNELICNIELKNGVFPYKGMEEKVISLVREYGLSERIIFSSFNHYSLVQCYRIAPEIEIAPLLAEGLYMPWVYAQSICAKGMHPQLLAAPDEIITAAMENGIAVRPYTVNSEVQMRRLFAIRCSAFFTDDPVKAGKVRAELTKIK